MREVRPTRHSLAIMVHTSLVEVTADKLNPLLQCLARVEASGRGIGRISRDYYDLWCLLKFRISREVRVKNLSENRLLRAASRLIR